MSQTKRTIALLNTAFLVMPLLAGCGNAPNTTSHDPYASRTNPFGSRSIPVDNRQKGMSTGKKVALLAGAAAMYYLWKKNQDQRQRGMDVPQYYLSKNGGVYYRDENKAVHWVRPPAGGIRVPEAEARAYKVDEFKGYNGRESGRSLAGLESARPF